MIKHRGIPHFHTDKGLPTLRGKAHVHGVRDIFITFEIITNLIAIKCDDYELVPARTFAHAIISMPSPALVDSGALYKLPVGT